MHAPSNMGIEPKWSNMVVQWGISGDKKAHMTNLVCHDVYVKMGGIHCAP